MSNPNMRRPTYLLDPLHLQKSLENYLMNEMTGIEWGSFETWDFDASYQENQAAQAHALHPYRDLCGKNFKYQYTFTSNRNSTMK